MPISDGLTSVVESIQAAATAVGALVVPALPGGRELPKSVMVKYKDLLAIIEHLRPRIVYLDINLFNAAKYISDTIDDEDDELIDHPLVKAEAKRLRRYDGLIQHVIAIIVHDGIDHAILEEPDWIDEARGAVDKVQASLDLEAESEAERHSLAVEKIDTERRERDERERQNLIREKAEVLRADERFGAGRVTKAKRRHLAKTLFPELPNAMLTKIVDEAEGSIWLESRAG